MTDKPPDLDFEFDVPFRPPTRRAWNFVGRVPSSIPWLYQVMRAVSYGVSAFAISTMFWGSAVETPEFSQRFRINATVVYIPHWAFTAVWLGCALSFALVGTCLADFWWHRRALVEVTPPLPPVPAEEVKEPSEPEEFYGKGLV